MCCTFCESLKCPFTRCIIHFQRTHHRGPHTNVNVWFVDAADIGRTPRCSPATRYTQLLPPHPQTRNSVSCYAPSAWGRGRSHKMPDRDPTTGAVKCPQTWDALFVDSGVGKHYREKEFLFVQVNTHQCCVTFLQSCHIEIAVDNIAILKKKILSGLYPHLQSQKMVVISRPLRAWSCRFVVALMSLFLIHSSPPWQYWHPHRRRHSSINVDWLLTHNLESINVDWRTTLSR